jgi:hypothetical protein
MKQSTTNNNKNENMKMRKTLITALVLGACVGTQAFAAAPAAFQTKEGVINFALTRQYQYQPNTNVFIPAPLVYSTKSAKITSANVIQAISMVLYGTPGHFSSKAVLILGKGGEWHGQSLDNWDHNPELTGFFGTFSPDNWEFSADLNGNVALDNGRNHHLNYVSYDINGDPIGDAVAQPTGLSQPWGQIWIKDIGQTDPVTGSFLCVNVTYFFTLKVQECYDCLYMNSFISDAKFKAGTQNGPPCCSPTFTQSGTGTDKYYLTLNFDNTVNNPHLNWYAYSENNTEWSNDWYVDLYSGDFPNYDGGLFETDDGVTPDALEPGGRDFHSYDQYTMRFTLNGILTYKWTLKNLNKTDTWPDFIGSASYPATGYGYVAKVCAMIDGTVTIAERLVADSDCCSVLSDGYDLSRGLYGAVDGFYTHPRGHYHAFNDEIFYHPGFNNNYQDYKEWFEEDIANWTPGVISEEEAFEGQTFGFFLAPLLP